MFYTLILLLEATTSLSSPSPNAALTLFKMKMKLNEEFMLVGIPIRSNYAFVQEFEYGQTFYVNHPVFGSVTRGGIHLLTGPRSPLRHLNVLKGAKEFEHGYPEIAAMIADLIAKAQIDLLIDDDLGPEYETQFENRPELRAYLKKKKVLDKTIDNNQSFILFAIADAKGRIYDIVGGIKRSLKERTKGSGKEKITEMTLQEIGSFLLTPVAIPLRTVFKKKHGLELALEYLENKAKFKVIERDDIIGNLRINYLKIKNIIQEHAKAVPPPELPNIERAIWQLLGWMGMMDLEQDLEALRKGEVQLIKPCGHYLQCASDTYEKKYRGWGYEDEKVIKQFKDGTSVISMRATDDDIRKKNYPRLGIKEHVLKGKKGNSWDIEYPKLRDYVSVLDWMNRHATPEFGKKIEDKIQTEFKYYRIPNPVTVADIAFEFFDGLPQAIWKKRNEIWALCMGSQNIIPNLEKGWITSKLLDYPIKMHGFSFGMDEANEIRMFSLAIQLEPWDGKFLGYENKVNDIVFYKNYPYLLSMHLNQSGKILSKETIGENRLYSFDVDEQIEHGFVTEKDHIYSLSSPAELSKDGRMEIVYRNRTQFFQLNDCIAREAIDGYMDLFKIQ